MASHTAAPALCEKFHRAVELIGARWSGAIVQVLLQGPVRYADLRAAVPDISDRMLCDRLRVLEEEGIVVRTVSPDPPVRVEYELSGKGRALQPALHAIGQWAERWLDARLDSAGAAAVDAGGKGPSKRERARANNSGKPARTKSAKTSGSARQSPRAQKLT